MAFPSTVYALLKNLTYMEITGAASVTIDEATNVKDVYDMDTHRNLFDAGSIGRDWVSTFGGSVTAAVTNNAFTFNNATIDPATEAPELFDDRLSKTPPEPTLKQRTMIIWWSAAAGTGDQVAMCWADQFVGYSGAIPRFVQ